MVAIENLVGNGYSIFKSINGSYENKSIWKSIVGRWYVRRLQLSGAAARTGEFKVIRIYKVYKNRDRGVYKNNINNHSEHRKKVNADNRVIV